jgi:hypothetical protein
MKSKSVLIALALFSAQVSAEWELVAESVSGDKYYIDLSTKRQQGKYTLVWTGVDYTKAEEYEGKDAYSAKTLAVYDCTEFKFGHKSAVFYSEKATQGEVVYNYSVEMHGLIFADVVPDSAVERSFNRACDKRK